MQQLAGRKSATITMEIYTHVYMTSKRNAVDVLQAAYMQAREEKRTPRHVS